MDFDTLQTKEEDKHSNNDKDVTQLSGDCSQDLQEKDLSEQTPILIKEQLEKKKLVGEDEHERLIEANRRDNDTFSKADNNKNNEPCENRIIYSNKRLESAKVIKIDKFKILLIVTISMALLLIYLK